MITNSNQRGRLTENGSQNGPSYELLVTDQHCGTLTGNLDDRRPEKIETSALWMERIPHPNRNWNPLNGNYGMSTSDNDGVVVREDVRISYTRAMGRTGTTAAKCDEVSSEVVA